MLRKMLWFSIPAVLGVLLAIGWQDVVRFTRIKKMSLGKGHPEIVPVEGRKAYAQNETQGALDGTGDFDSARRGGPVHAEPGPVKPGEVRRG
ncbi:MAG TPA: hypothetical protein VE733_01905 [Streptosporangiaceae bacterium]|jgi:hypothetical protein|nr:hypothetical protein [Streptosporangiaceae bacterium]